MPVSPVVRIISPEDGCSALTTVTEASCPIGMPPFAFFPPLITIIATASMTMIPAAMPIFIFLLLLISNLLCWFTQLIPNIKS